MPIDLAPFDIASVDAHTVTPRNRLTRFTVTLPLVKGKQPFIEVIRETILVDQNGEQVEEETLKLPPPASATIDADFFAQMVPEFNKIVEQIESASDIFAPKQDGMILPVVVKT